MDLRQITYIVKIAEEGSITKAAAQLYISQSGLNQQLLKLEKELGVPLFHRSKYELRPTQAGQIYLTYGRRMLEEKREAYARIHDIANNNTGSLRIGLTPERGTTMLLHIYDKFHAQFPHIIIEPEEIHVKKQLSMLMQDYLDIGFVTLTEQDKLPGMQFVHIKKEPILLGIPRSHPLAVHANAPYKPYACIDLSLFAKDRFILMFKGSTLRGVIDPLFEEAGFAPDILFETASNRTLYTMVKQSMGCTLIPETYALEQDSIAYFLLPQNPIWELAIAYRSGHYLSEPAKAFIRLAKDYWTSI
ncbi:HTH-type transcriptional regulator CynR [Eubacterium plexicaudatum ASF492]|uniref:HTH lysR-type domain-containing protein n=1 Tax=Eubacterium plexicaudatum ASF492 TaxID=1235802 RepID=N2BDD1_9FIRM|nr:HTH-type transcriptional regulator CynR [Eubacterium plexicaudatum ASF492]